MYAFIGTNSSEFLRIARLVFGTKEDSINDLKNDHKGNQAEQRFAIMYEWTQDNNLSKLRCLVLLLALHNTCLRVIKYSSGLLVGVCLCLVLIIFLKISGTTGSAC